MDLRHEWKHRISRADLLTLRQRLGILMDPDPHAKNGSYFVRSLYFDSPDNKALLEKLDGVSHREKFRIRYYDLDTTVIHLEKKTKCNGLGSKDSAPLSVTSADRPMIDWIYASEEYTQLYHQYFREFLDTVDAQAIIQQAKTLIAPYVEKDPTKFCTYEEFETGVKTLSAFCDLRSQSVAAQLEGRDANIDTSSLNLSDMGSMGGEKMPTRQESIEQETQAQPQGMEPGQMPDFQGGFPGAERSPQQGGFPGEEQPVQQENIPAREQTQSQSGWVLPLVSVAVLAAGLWIAFKSR